MQVPTPRRREIFVALAGADDACPVPVGALSFTEVDIKPGTVGTCRVSFSYLAGYEGPPLDPLHLNHDSGQRSFALDAALGEVGLFRVFSDCPPGAFGRNLIAREHPETSDMNDLRLLAWLAEGGLGDPATGRPAPEGHRGHASGALLFFTRRPGDETPLRTLAEVEEFRTKTLREVADMAAAVESRELVAAVVHGGARPKTTFQDMAGEVGPAGLHYLVKYNTRLDAYNSARVEHAMLELAQRSGIQTARSLVVHVRARGEVVADIYLTERYDRPRVDGHDLRRHRISALALCDVNRVRGVDSGDYADIADVIRRVSADPDADVRQLFRRLVFAIGVNNTDDHLKNHEMIHLGAEGWRLAPAYDLLPNNQPYTHTTAIAGLSNGSLKDDFMRRVATRLDIPVAEAMTIRDEVVAVLLRWRTSLRELGCSEHDMNYVQAAFNQSGRLAERDLGFGRGLPDPLASARSQPLPSHTPRPAAPDAAPSKPTPPGLSARGPP